MTPGTQFIPIDRSRRAMVFLLMLAGIAFGTMISSASAAQASQQATPVAGTPEPLDPAESRAGRLGGQLADVIEFYGQPDWTDEGLIGYNNVSLADIDTITMVFFDDQERIRSYLLVYLEKPAELDVADRIAEVVAEVAPRDGACGSEPIDSDLGDNVYGCESSSLNGLISPAEMLEFDVIGADGSYSYAVDPTEDEFFEITVRFGTGRPRDPQDPEPTIVPTPKPPLEERYPPLDAIENLTDGTLHHGDAVSLSGTVVDVAQTPAGVRLLIDASGGDGSTGAVEVVVLDDLTGIEAGSFVTVFGMFSGTGCEVGGSCLATIYVIEPLS